MSYTKVCEACGKRFIVEDLRTYAYKVGTGRGKLYACSYSCLNKIRHRKHPCSKRV